MSEIYHDYGQGLKLSPTGGLMMVSGSQQGQQKIIRRLLTSAGDLLSDLNFGTGIPKMIGSPGNETKIKATIIQQMKMEPIVKQSPIPTVGVTTDGNGLYQAIISYVDNETLERNVIRQPISTEIGTTNG